MLKRLVTIAVLILLAGYAASFLASQDGKTVIQWLGYRVEVQTSLLVTVMAAIIFLVVMMDRLLSFLAGLPGRLSGRIRNRRQEEGQQALALGLVAAAVGDQDEAAKNARRARRLTGGNTLTGLLDAQVATLKGDTEAASRFFGQLTDNRATAWLGHAGTMRLRAEAGDDEAALEAGRAAFATRRNEPGLARALFALEARHGNWREAITALEEAKRHRQSGANSKEAMRETDIALAVLHYQLARSLMERGETTGKDEGIILSSLENALKHHPGLTPAVLEAADIHMQRGKKRKAVSLLEKAFLNTPHPDLAARLMDCWGGEDAASLARLMRLSDRGGNRLEAISACATIALKLMLWGEARRLAELVSTAERDAVLWSVLAEVGRNAPEDAAADDWPDPRYCLEEAARAPRSAAWTCRQCGATTAEWGPHCPSCEAFAALDWRMAKNTLPVAPADDTATPLPNQPD